MIAQLVGAAFLIGFGAWVIVQGVRLITQFYPRTLELKPSPERDVTIQTKNQPQLNLMSSLDKLISSEINALTVSIPAKPSARSLDDGGRLAKLSGAGDPPREDEEDPGGGEEPEEPTGGENEEEQEAGGSTDRVSAIARIIEAIPSILNANFGPAAMLCLIGLTLCAGGFYLILNLAAQAAA
jgi:hypothetical protein